VAFNGKEAMVGINALPTRATFHWVDGSLRSSNGFLVVMPSKDTADRVAKMIAADPGSVFVVEFGPHGPLTEHEIVLGS
jgi:hypothetical protein